MAIVRKREMGQDVVEEKRTIREKEISSPFHSKNPSSLLSNSLFKFVSLLSS